MKQLVYPEGMPSAQVCLLTGLHVDRFTGLRVCMLTGLQGCIDGGTWKGIIFIGWLDCLKF
jgi:hypothetical protein